MKNFYLILVIYSMVYVNFETVVASETSEVQTVQRKKRDIGTIVTIVAGLLPQVYEIIREIIKLKCGNKITSSMANSMFNNNLSNVENMMTVATARMAEAGEAIHMRPQGYNCDITYCQEIGPNASGTLGICSKQYCTCRNGYATIEKCGFWRVYDPLKNKCSWKRSAILCH